MSMPQQTQPDRLPIWLTAQLAFRNVFGNLRTFFALATIPMVLTLVCAFLGPGLISGGGEGQVLSPGIFLGFLIAMLATVFFASVFFVAWHRFIITGTRDSKAPLQLIMGRRELRFFWILLLLSFMLAIPVVIFMNVFLYPAVESGGVDGTFWVLFAVMLIGIALVSIRVSVRFPAIAMDRDKGFRAAWRQTKGSTWRIFVALVIVCLPIVVLELLLGQIPAEGDFATIILMVISTVLSFLQHALIASVLSLAYTWLVPSWKNISNEPD